MGGRSCKTKQSCLLSYYTDLLRNVQHCKDFRMLNIQRMDGNKDDQISQKMK